MVGKDVRFRSLKNSIIIIPPVLHSKGELFHCWFHVKKSSNQQKLFTLDLHAQVLFNQFCVLSRLSSPWNWKLKLKFVACYWSITGYAM